MDEAAPSFRTAIFVMGSGGPVRDCRCRRAVVAHGLISCIDGVETVKAVGLACRDRFEP